MFRIAQARNNKLMPVATVVDLFNPCFRYFLGKSTPKIGIYIPYESVDQPLLFEGIRMLGCTPEECVLFLDFSGVPLEVDNGAVAIAAIFDDLGMFARWAKIVFQGSAFPRKNPAAEGGQSPIPRREWSVFLEVMKECSLSPELIGYGDYGPDSGKISFPKPSRGGRAIRHLRYTGNTDILVVRGSAQGTDEIVMRDVCKRILTCGQYSGQQFSYADERIWRIANGIDGPGNASIWRELNIAHHITHVIRTLGEMVGISFALGSASELVEQQVLL